MIGADSRLILLSQIERRSIFYLPLITVQSHISIIGITGFGSSPTGIRSFRRSFWSAVVVVFRAKEKNTLFEAPVRSCASLSHFLSFSLVHSVLLFQPASRVCCADLFRPCSACSGSCFSPFVTRHHHLLFLPHLRLLRHVQPFVLIYFRTSIIDLL